MNSAIETYCERISTTEKKILYPSRQLITNIITGKSALELEDIEEELFVKLHNISFAYDKLSEMYELMNVKKINQTILEHLEFLNERKRNSKIHDNFVSGQFRIQVVCAENLKPTNKNGSSDPFAVMRVPEGTVLPPLEKVQRADNETQKDRGLDDLAEDVILRGDDCVLFRQQILIRTRYISSTINPRWDESFAIMCPPVDRLEIATFTKNLITADEISGQSIINLSNDSKLKELLKDNQAHDVLVKLHPQGNILLRIQMVGQEEDIEYWFKKTFQHLDRTRDTLIRLITGKIDPFIAQSISRAIKENGVATISTAGSFFKQFSIMDNRNEVTANGISIHDPADESDAIIILEPLIDYLEKNFASICTNLEPSVARVVIEKLWQTTVQYCTTEMVPPLFGLFNLKKLSIRQVSMCQWCLELLRDFFHGDGGEFGLDFKILDSPQYLDLQELFMYYHESPNTIKEEYLHSLESGIDKTLLLRLMRLYQDGEKVWLDEQMQNRRNMNISQ